MDTATATNTPYWNVNLPREDWSDNCPDYLRGVDEGDKAQLAVRDEDYERMSWEEVKHLVEMNRLEQFKRVPSQLHMYRRYIKQIKESHGSVMNLILKERLRWGDVTPKGPPFARDEDLRILYNDWPYGIDERIVHLVVWTKFGFEEDSETGDLTLEARQMIDNYVSRTFRTQLDMAKVVWFKNWAALKSVHAIEHFHVMLYDPDPAFVQKVTQSDVPMGGR